MYLDTQLLTTGPCNSSLPICTSTSISISISIYIYMCTCVSIQPACSSKKKARPTCPQPSRVE